MPFTFKNLTLNNRTDLLAGKVVQQDSKGLLVRDFTDRIATVVPAVTAPSTPPADPSFKKAAGGTFGVMAHVDPVRDHFLLARSNIDALRLRLTKSKPTRPSLLDRVLAFLAANLPEGKKGKAWLELMHDLAANDSTEDVDFTARLNTRRLPYIGQSVDVTVEKPDGGAPTSQTTKHNAHTALFHASVALMDDGRDLELLRGALAKLLELKALEQEDKEEALRDVESSLPAELEKLESLQRDRLEALEDYTLAQRLLAEHWQEVERATERRRKIILSSPQIGLVKARETPVSRTLPDPQELRSARLDDLVPGIPDRDRPVPPSLQPFLEALLDVPASHWTSLHNLASHHPPRPVLERQILQSRVRRTFRIDQPPTILPFLSPLFRGAHLREVQALPFNAPTLVALQEQAHRILSVEDLLASSVPALRDPARTLHRRLDAFAGGLVDTLRLLPPSLRLTWSEAAEEDRLPVEAAESWPGIGRMEDDEALTTRTVVDLVHWFFRQLHPEASEATRGVFHNLVRACLMLAASDDPAELLAGTVISRPTQLVTGARLRLTLNREPEPGTMLQLLDEVDRVVGSVRVTDHDAEGSVVSLVNLHVPASTLGATLRVAGRAR